MPSSSSDLESPGSLLSPIIRNIGLLGGILYFGGWVYLNRYYSQFAIDIALLDLSWYDIVVHSAAFLTNGLRMALRWPAVIILVAILAASWYLERNDGLLSMLLDKAHLLNSRLLPLLIAVLGLTGASLAAQYVGAAQARRDWMVPREPIVLGFKDDGCQNDELLKDANQNRRLRLLKSTSKWYFVFIQNEHQKSGGSSMPIRIFHVPTSCIVSATQLVHPR